MNEMTQEIKNKVQQYGIDLRFVSRSEGFCEYDYATVIVYPDRSLNEVGELVDQMISERGELLLLRKALAK